MVVRCIIFIDPVIAQCRGGLTVGAIWAVQRNHLQFLAFYIAHGKQEIVARSPYYGLACN